MKARSLVRRVILSVLLIESMCALGFVSSSVWHEYRMRLRALDVTLQGRSDSLIGAVRDAEDPEDQVMVDPDEFRLRRTCMRCTAKAASSQARRTMRRRI
jgi:hypothetical protein